MGRKSALSVDSISIGKLEARGVLGVLTLASLVLLIQPDFFGKILGAVGFFAVVFFAAKKD